MSDFWSLHDRNLRPRRTQKGTHWLEKVLTFHWTTKMCYFVVGFSSLDVTVYILGDHYSANDLLSPLFSTPTRWRSIMNICLSKSVSVFEGVFGGLCFHLTNLLDITALVLTVNKNKILFRMHEAVRMYLEMQSSDHRSHQDHPRMS